MKKHIDVENYCNNICKCAKDHCDKSSCPIWNAPAADVVEVVRCKDCKYASFMRADGSKSEHVVNCGEFFMDAGLCSDNDFCSYGERRKQE